MSPCVDELTDFAVSQQKGNLLSRHSQECRWSAFYTLADMHEQQEGDALDSDPLCLV
jgi:hypothetical protein